MSDSSAADKASDQTTDQAAAAKGRPTPTRAEAEAARKARLNPTADKKADKAEGRKRREEARMGQLRGDARYLPARDRGPVRAFIRDWVDSRFSVGEILMPTAFAFIFLNFYKNTLIQTVSTWLFFGVFILMIVDQFVIGILVSRAVRNEFGPKGTDGTKGAVLYAVMRSTQMRRLRVPLPKVRIGGKPK
ncbi:MAG: hypothetical protein RL745_293 [Actinomycetota bacterium]